MRWLRVAIRLPRARSIGLHTARHAVVTLPAVAPIAVGIALAVAGCSWFNPRSLDHVQFKQEAQTQERGGLRVTVAVLDGTEAKHAFGVDLQKQRIQPVWVEVENGTDVPRIILLSSLDPDYFSAREAAYKCHYRLSFGSNRRIDRHFASLDMETFVAAHTKVSGFVFTNLKLGTKEVRVKLFAPRRVDVFEFYVPVRGFKADWHAVDWQRLAAETVFTNYDDEDEFRRVLRELPCCTFNKSGTGKGDPVNLVLIGGGQRVATALVKAGWDETELLTFASGWRTFKAFFGGTYKHSPMSALYLYGRAQDVGFQKARDTIHERNHLRLWLSPLRFRGEHVWVGTITRDIGVYFTTRAWNLATHAIDPDVDEARQYVMQDLALSQVVERIGFVDGVGMATPDAPHRNHMGAKWWSDGLRAVMQLAGHPVPLEFIRFFHWDWRYDPGDLQELLSEQDDSEAASGAPAAASPVPGRTGGPSDP